MSPEVVYAFTLCLADDGGGPIGSRVSHTMAFLAKYIRHCHYRLYPEISKVGRLHYHGYIWFNSYEEIFQFNLNTMAVITHDKSCDIEIDTINYEFGDVYWYCYVRKMKHLLKPYFGKNKIKYRIDTYIEKTAGLFNTAKEQFKSGVEKEKPNKKSKNYLVLDGKKYGAISLASVCGLDD